MSELSDITKDFFDSKASSWDSRSKSNLSYLKEMILESGISEGDSVLDVACGTGIITGILNSLTHKKVIGLDLSTEMIKIANEKYKNNQEVEFYAQDFINYQGEEKDIIFMFNAYPHFLDLEALKNAIYRNLKVGGKFVIFSDLSLERLKVHHQHCMHVSREINSLKDDFKIYNQQFDIIKNEDDEKHYLVIGIKNKFLLF